MPLNNQSRLGTSSAELLVAIILLGSVLAIVGRFVSSANQGLADRTLASTLEWEIINHRELIGSWRPAEITQQRIEALPVPASISRRLVDAQWEANVTKITQPAHALQVQLRLTCTMHGQSAIPARLTFWVEGEQNDDE